MKDLEASRENLFKYGYCVVRNLLSSEEIEYCKTAIEKVSAKMKADVVIGIHNHKECWNFIAHKKLLNIIKNLLGSEIRYLYVGATRREQKGDWFYAWHRDNTCRLFGIGPDWNKKELYNIVRAGIYLSPYDIANSGVNIIPFSHKTRYSFSSLLRLFHWKTKNSNNLFIKMIRKNFEKFIGINIKTNPGDCVLFLAHVMHCGIPPTGPRKAIFLTYGTENIHAENYVNYWIKHRPIDRPTVDSYDQFHAPVDNIIDLENFLKTNKIYYPIPEKKKFIEGISIPKKNNLI